MKPDLEKVKILTERYEASEGQEVLSQPKTQKTTFYWAICGCVFHPQRLTDQKSQKCPQLSCGNSTFTDHSFLLASTQPVHGSIKAMDKELLEEAERIAGDEFGLKKLLVISALGTRRYYMRFGLRDVMEFTFQRG